jgi:hypothetical protein
MLKNKSSDVSTVPGVSTNQTTAHSYISIRKIVVIV